MGTDNERATAQDEADQFLVAVAAAGQAMIALQSGMGMSEVGIQRAETGEDSPYRAICTPHRYQDEASTLRFLLAGEVAQVSLGLSSFHEINIITEHFAAANLIRDWDEYWKPYTYFYSLHDDWLVDEVDEEIKNLIWVARWQIRRQFRYERAVIENLALSIRDRELLSGEEVEGIIRRK